MKLFKKINIVLLFLLVETLIVASFIGKIEKNYGFDKYFLTSFYFLFPSITIWALFKTQEFKAFYKYSGEKFTNKYAIFLFCNPVFSAMISGIIWFNVLFVETVIYGPDFRYKEIIFNEVISNELCKIKEDEDCKNLSNERLLKLGVFHHRLGNEDRSQEFLERACQDNFKDSCFRREYYNLSYSGKVMSLDKFKKYCNEGIGFACHVIAKELNSKSVTEEGMKYAIKSCKNGFIGGCSSFAAMNLTLQIYRKTVPVGSNMKQRRIAYDRFLQSGSENKEFDAFVRKVFHEECTNESANSCSFYQTYLSLIGSLESPLKEMCIVNKNGTACSILYLENETLDMEIKREYTMNSCKINNSICYDYAEDYIENSKEKIPYMVKSCFFAEYIEQESCKKLIEIFDDSDAIKNKIQRLICDTEKDIFCRNIVSL